jgi:voltage-gated potassium channel
MSNHKTSFKQQLHTIIFEAETRGGKAFDVALFIMIMGSIAVVMLESVAALDAKYHRLFYALEWFFTIVFTVEYALRIYSIGTPMRYIWSFYGIIDLLAILPTYLAIFFAGSHMLVTVRILRLLRIFRVLKLSRFMSESNALLMALWASRRKISVFLFVVFLITIIMGTLMYLIEGKENGFTSIPLSIYWAIVTLTTVGFGDITPKTELGQALAAFIMILGYGIIAVPTGIVSSEMVKANNQDSGTTDSCHNCGAEGHRLGAKFCYKCGHVLDL